MKLLDKVWDDFGQREKTAFLTFVDRKIKGKKSADSRYLQNYDPDVPVSNKEAAIRKRLHKDLARFIGQKNAENEQSESMGQSYLQLAQFLFDRKHNNEAWIILRKVESLAESNKFYQLLNAVYLTMIDHTNTQFADPVAIILEKKKLADKRRSEDETLKIRLALIREWFQREKEQGNKAVVSSLIGRINELIGEKFIFDHPGHVLNLLEMARTVCLAARNIEPIGEIALELKHTLEES